MQVSCNECKHRKSLLTCKAFPKGIPLQIQSGEFDHRKPFPNNKKRLDNNIVFEAK
jgi:hypothetical protein